MSLKFTESVVEEATLDWFRDLNYQIVHGPEIAPGEANSERTNYNEVILVGRLRSALAKINPNIPSSAREDALKKILRTSSPSLFVNNYNFHKMLTDGIDVEYPFDGRSKHDKVWPIDFQNPENNDWVALNQYTVIENANRRPDVVVFTNGLPIALIELKNPGDEDATVKGAFNQFQTYKKDIPGIFTTNEILIISDGVRAKVGTLTANWDRFMPWRTIEGKDVAPATMPELEVVVKGIFEKSRLLDLIRNFIVFEVDGSEIIKKMAGYHQFHAVNIALEHTITASSPKGDKRIGVVWHTQGSGKSLTMAFYAGKLILHPTMENPTILILTDRNDLDEQLFDSFSKDRDLLRQTPVQAESRDHLRELLKVASGGVIFTTVQKFVPPKGERFPLLSDRRNIVVIADEAHRSQYDFIDGFARHIRDGLPNASFIGFTGTPIETADKNTRAIFGEYIDVYDIHRAVVDEFTVRIFYEGRLAKLSLKEDEKPKIDQEFEDVTEDQEESERQKLKTKWARVEVIVGSEKRIKQVAEDIVNHFENRLQTLDGKGMIVCMSRRICVDLYDQIIKLRPTWHDDDDMKGAVKVVMTGSAMDPEHYYPHVRNKIKRELIKKRLKDPEDPLKLVIVRDMWLTGFDAPVLHTMYVDKPMQSHGLMQAIARVNRVFKDKPGGLIVDYIGIAHNLKKALNEYTKADQEEAGIDQEVAVALMLEKYEIVKGLFHNFDYSVFFNGKPTERLAMIPTAMAHILNQENGKTRFLSGVSSLSRAFALSVPNEQALAIKDEVGFFQTLRASFVKTTVTDEEERDVENMDTAIRQLISKAIFPKGVIDLFVASGIKAPDISILSDEFLAELKNMKYKNLAVELLNRLLKDEIKIRSKINLVQSRSFSEMLNKAIKKYENRSIEAAQIITELIELAKEMRDAYKRGEKIGLSDAELAFYDALEVNDSAVKVLGDKILQDIARDLVETIRNNVTIDWTVKENVRAKLRTAVKHILRKYGYPPDKQEKATQTVLEQAELIAKDWAET